MSLTDARMQGRSDAPDAGASFADADRAAIAPIIPPGSIPTRALLGVIAIMSFLASLTLGAVVLVRGAAADWQSDVSREITIQVRPVAGRDLERDVESAAALARGIPGIAEVKPTSSEESARLLEPWLGTGLALQDLPVPRLVLVTVAAGKPPDLDRLRRALAEGVPSASLDDHRGFIERMRSVTRMAALLGVGVLALMLGATVLLVAFATEGAMAANRPIVEVLHFVGAKNHYIAGQFQRHFLLLGLKGAAMGSGLAAALFVLVRLLAIRFGGDGGEGEAVSFLGSLVLGPQGYAGIAGVTVLTAAVAALTSRWTVHRTLDALE